MKKSELLKLLIDTDGDPDVVVRNSSSTFTGEITGLYEGVKREESGFNTNIIIVVTE